MGMPCIQPLQLTTELPSLQPQSQGALEVPSKQPQDASPMELPCVQPLPLTTELPSAQPQSCPVLYMPSLLTPCEAYEVHLFITNLIAKRCNLVVPAPQPMADMAQKLPDSLPLPSQVQCPQVLSSPSEAHIFSVESELGSPRDYIDEAFEQFRVKELAPIPPFPASCTGGEVRPIALPLSHGFISPCTHLRKGFCRDGDLCRNSHLTFTSKADIQLEIDRIHHCSAGHFQLSHSDVNGREFVRTVHRPEFKFYLQPSDSEIDAEPIQSDTESVHRSNVNEKPSSSSCSDPLSENSQCSATGRAPAMHTQ